MRLSSVISAALIASSSFLIASGPVAAQNYNDGRSCIGSCDRYGNPTHYEPRLPDETGFGPGYQDDDYDDDDDRYDDDDRSYVGDPVYQYPENRRYRKRVRKHRTYRRHRSRYANRTKFCRTHTEMRGEGFFSRHKVNVKRCVWVRNDLVPNYAEGGYSSHRYSSGGRGYVSERW